jgi:hypothetical protein
MSKDTAEPDPHVREPTSPFARNAQSNGFAEQDSEADEIAHMSSDEVPKLVLFLKHALHDVE